MQSPATGFAALLLSYLESLTLLLSCPILILLSSICILATRFPTCLSFLLAFISCFGTPTVLLCFTMLALVSGSATILLLFFVLDPALSYLISSPLKTFK